MKKRFGYVVVSALLCAAFVLYGCASEQTDDSVVWSLEPVEDIVDLHTQLQSDYLKGDYLDITSYAQGEEELSRPETLTLHWSADCKDESVKINSYSIEYATRENFGDSMTYSTTATEYDITNLYLGTTYYWRVTAQLSDGGKSISPTETFRTGETGPRNLYVEGITNVRDLGGWKTSDGGTVKQGMIFRCGRLNKSETSTPLIEITDDGIQTMLYEFGVRSEIDLRMKEKHNHEAGGITQSPLGESVLYYNVELEWGTGNYLLDNLPSVREFFRLASDESNYPFIFHCNIGTDRTGMFAFLINGLLGVSEDDLYRDYLFSNFGKINGQRTLDNIKNDYLKTIQETEGSTLSEKIRNCLTSNGVPGEQLDAIVQIMK